MTKSLSVQTGIGLAIAALGITVMTGWVLRNPALVQMRASFVAMVFNTALCFTLLGVVFLLSALPSSRPRVVAQQCIAALVAALAALVLTEALFDISLGIDAVGLHDWLIDGNPRPGRMAPNTALGLLMAGVVLVLLPYVRTKRGVIAIYAATFMTMMLGLTGLVGYSLQLELLYTWFNAARMAVHTAIGMVLVSAALWASIASTDWYRARSLFGPDDIIVLTGVGVLVVVAATAGVTGFAMQQSALEKALSEKLGITTANRRDTFRSEIEKSLVNARGDASRPLLVALLRAQRARDDVAARLPALQAVAQNILVSNTAAVAIRDNRRELLRAGSFLKDSDRTAIFAVGASSVLRWDDGFVLHSVIPIRDAQGPLGILELAQPLPFVTQQLGIGHQPDVTGETEVCVAIAARLRCYPTASRPQIYDAPTRDQRGQPTPMWQATQGRTGIFKGVNYRGEKVIAAYAPLAPGGLGLVVYERTEELFSPIREQLELIVPLIFLLIAAGAGLLHWRVKPVAVQLLRSEREARDKELRLRTIVGSMNEGLLTIDEDGRIESISEVAATMFGYASADVIGAGVGLLLPLDMGEARDGVIRDARNGATMPLAGSVELPVQHRDGYSFAIELSISAITLEGQRLFVGIVRDITERKIADEALFAEKERLRVTLHSIGDGVITTDDDGYIVYLNPVAESMTGWSLAEARSQPILTVFNIVDEHTHEPAPNPVAQVLRERAPAGLAEDTLLVHRSGEKFPIEDSAAPIRDIDGHIIGVVLVFHDVSEARMMASKMTHLAKHDALTGLVNRREFERRLDVSLRSGQVEAKVHSMLYLDLDQFKIVNDTCGHMAGDELLRQLSSLMQGRLRHHDTLARLGGDEFGVLLDDCPTEAALDVAESLRQIVSDFQFVWQDRIFPIGVSVGLVTFSDGGLDMTDVLRMADAACYVSKDKGRNRIHVYTQEDAEIAHRQGEMGWIGRLHQALDHDDFVLYAQQILPLAPGHDSHDHFEILLRMRDGEKIVPPMAFIPAAERYGLMPLVDRWVIQSAFRNEKVRQLGVDGGTCAINLSGASISDEGFLDFVLAQFDAEQILPETVCFEITETTAITNLSSATALIAHLKDAGCRFSLDDFGSGMSSFGYLKHLPVDYLKIDGGFVKDMLDDPIDCAMVESINHIGHVTGIQTIAEFVEDDVLLWKLREIGVDYAQGYGIGKPQPL